MRSSTEVRTWALIPQDALLDRSEDLSLIPQDALLDRGEDQSLVSQAAAGHDLRIEGSSKSASSSSGPSRRGRGYNGNSGWLHPGGSCCKPPTRTPLHPKGGENDIHIIQRRHE